MDKEYLIKKWLDNDLNPQEQQAFDALEDSTFYKEILEEGKRFKLQNTNKVITFEELHQQLKPQTTNNNNWIPILSKVAAVLIISFGIYFYLFQNNTVTYDTTIAQRQDIILPDESSVVLQEESTLSFDKKAWENEKKLQLYGEAYFKVTKGQRFEVHTNQGTVTVLGTEFTVVSRKNIFHVTCYEGLVSVAHQNKEIKLRKGQALETINGKSSAYEIPLSEPQWLRNMSVFKNTALSEVLKTMEDVYNVKIETMNTDNTILFTGAFEHGNIENSLQSITETLQLSYEIKTNGVILIKKAKIHSNEKLQ